MKPIIYLLTAIGLISCASLNSISKEENLLVETDLGALNGKYQIISTDTSYRNLAYALIQFDRDRSFATTGKDEWVSLEIIDAHHLRVSVYQNDTLIKESIKKGKFKKGHFILCRDWKFPILYGVINVYSTQKTRISLTENKDLYLDTDGLGCGLLILFPFMCAGDSQYGLEFKRIKMVANRVDGPARTN